MQFSFFIGKYCFGVDDTLRALEMGAVETLICWENLDIQRYTLKNHGSGEQKILGQSALRFARLRMEKRHNYVRKVAETAVTLFIANDKPNISGLILAGSADFKTELSQSDMFDPRLQNKIIKLVDVSYGGENGFNQAIELAAESLANVKFIQEKKLINSYFDQISQDTGIIKSLLKFHENAIFILHRKILFWS